MVQEAVFLFALGFLGLHDADCFAQVDPGYDFFGMSHPVGGYNVYTFHHLPMLSCRPELDNKEEAKVASLAARIAFSSLPIRSRFR